MESRDKNHVIAMPGMSAQRSLLLASLLNEREMPPDVDVDEEWARSSDEANRLKVAMRGLARIHARMDSNHTDLLNELTLKRRIFDSVLNGVTVVDASAPDLPLTYVNPGFERMTGYSRYEAMGRNCRFLQAEDTDQPGVAAVRAAIRDRRAVTAVLKNYRKNGTLFWNELHLSPLFDEDGKLTHFVGIQNDITSRVHLEQRMDRMEHMALHDELTGLSNRALLMDNLHRALMRAGRSGNCVGLFMIDLNKFKSINDIYGHMAGDGMLKLVAERITQAIRESDCAARIGGDEFVIVAPDLAGEAEAELLRVRIAALVEKPVALGGQTLMPSISLGLSLFPRDGGTPEELLNVADQKMYRQKHGGTPASP